MKNLLSEDGEALYYPNFLSPELAKRYFTLLKEKVNWEQKSMHLYDKRVLLPRLTAWFGDSGQDYKYSGVLNQTQPWLEELLELKSILSEKPNLEFNSCLLNLYRSGKDHVSWHSDNEKELGLTPTIASLSLGGVRSFQFKHKIKELETIKLDLKPGDLVVMKGLTQRNWLHRVAPTAKDVDPRINLTFRNVKI